MTEQPQSTPAPPTPTAPVGEPRRQRIGRHAHRTVLYSWAVLLAVALIYLIALIIANTRHVKVSWVFGSGTTSLIWLIVIPAILGWLVGMATAELFRRRTRRPR
jgi:uncharacterized integral membrane protein